MGRSVLKVKVDNLKVDNLKVDNLKVDNLRGPPSGQKWPGISEPGEPLHVNTLVCTNLWWESRGGLSLRPQDPFLTIIR